jgi:hypothetical protein
MKLHDKLWMLINDFIQEIILNIDWSGVSLIWCRMVQFGAVWGRLGQFGAVWCSLVR